MVHIVAHNGNNQRRIQNLLTRFKITQALLILNKENLTLVLRTQMKMKSAKLLKT